MFRYVFLAFIAFLTLLLYIFALTKENYVTNTSIQYNILKNCESIHEDKTKIKTKKIKQHVPKVMMDLYEKNLENLKNDGDFPKIVRSLIPVSLDKKITGEDFGDVLVFRLPVLNEDEEFIGAELKVLTLVEGNSEVVEGVRRLVKIAILDDHSNQTKHVDKLQVYHKDNTWVTFNVTGPVRDLLEENERKSFKVAVGVESFFKKNQEEALESERRIKLSLMPDVEDSEHDYPILLLSYVALDENEINYGNELKTILNDAMISNVRKRRNVEDEYEEESNVIWEDDVSKKAYVKKMRRKRNSCRRLPLYVDFAEIEYDTWIVQPRGYEVHYNN